MTEVVPLATLHLVLAVQSQCGRPASRTMTCSPAGVATRSPTKKRPPASPRSKRSPRSATGSNSPKAAEAILTNVTEVAAGDSRRRRRGLRHRLGRHGVQYGLAIVELPELAADSSCHRCRHPRVEPRRAARAKVCRLPRRAGQRTAPCSRRWATRRLARRWLTLAAIDASGTRRAKVSAAQACWTARLTTGSLAASDRVLGPDIDTAYRRLSAQRRPSALRYEHMPTVLRVGRYRFRRFSATEGNESTAHSRQGIGSTKRNSGLIPVQLAANYGFDTSEINEIERLVREHRELLLEAWHEHLDSSQNAVSTRVCADDGTGEARRL